MYPRWLFWSNDNYFEKLTLLPNNVLAQVVTSSFGSLGSMSRDKSGYVGAIVRRLTRICATSTHRVRIRSWGLALAPLRFIQSRSQRQHSWFRELQSIWWRCALLQGAHQGSLFSTVDTVDSVLS